MAQSFPQLVARWQSQAFLDQCTWAVLFLIRYINDEPTNTANHTNRILWARAAMANPSAMGQRMSAMAITDNACTADTVPSDAQVQAAIEALVNRYTE